MFSQWSIISPWDVIAPFAIAAAVLLAGWRPRRGTGARCVWVGVLGPIGLAIGFVVRLAVIHGRWPGFPPADAKLWIAYAAIGCALAGIALPEWIDSRLWRSAIICAALAIVSNTLCLWPLLRNSESRTGALMLVVAASLTAVFWVTAFSIGARNAPYLTAAAPIWLSLASGVLLITTYSVLLGRDALALCGAVVPIQLSVHQPSRGRRTWRSGGIVCAVCVTTLLAMGQAYSELSISSAVLIALAPAGHLIFVFRGKPRTRRLFALIALTLLALLPMISIGLTLRGYLLSLGNSDEGYGI